MKETKAILAVPIDVLRKALGPTALPRPSEPHKPLSGELKRKLNMMDEVHP